MKSPKSKEVRSLVDTLEKHDLCVYLTKQDGKVCAEVETFTGYGVNMIIWLSPFSLKEFKRYVEDFDVDEQIEMHREDERYKSAFSISQSLADFTAFKERLEEIIENIENGGGETKTIPFRSAFVLFQTDIHMSVTSRVFFGVFDSFEAADKAAKDNNLHSHDSEVLILETETNKFEEQ